MTLFFYASVAILVALLFFPVSKIIWVSSVRRLERKLQKTLSDEERMGQKRRAQVITLMLLIPFSWFFNMHLLNVG